MASTLDPVAVEDIHGDRRWLSQHQRIVEDCRLKNPRVLFVGDSIIQRLQDTDVWETQIEPMHAVNAGIGGDQVQHVHWRLQNGLIKECKPQVVVLSVGTNNIPNTCDEILEGIESIAWTISNALPNTKIITLGLLPRGENPNHLREKIYQINYGLEKMVTTIPNTYFLNPDPGFVRGDNKIAPEDMLDYLHPTRRGYKRLAPPIVGLLKKFLH